MTQQFHPPQGKEPLWKFASPMFRSSSLLLNIMFDVRASILNAERLLPMERGSAFFGISVGVGLRILGVHVGSELSVQCFLLLKSCNAVGIHVTAELAG